MSDLKLQQYVGVLDPAKVSELAGKVLETHFTLRDFGDKDVNARKLFYWKKMGVVWQFSLMEEEKRVWAKFSFCEYVWLKMVIALRKLEVSVSLIEKFMKNITRKVLLREMLVCSLNVEQLSENLPEEQKEAIAELLNSEDPDMREAIDTVDIPMLLFIIIAAILKRENMKILINHNGDYMIYTDFAHIQDDESREFLEASHISISMNEIVSEFVSKKEMLNISGKLELLTSREVQLIKIIREGMNLKSVTVRFDAEHKIDLVEETKNQLPKVESRLLDLIMKNGYHNIEIATENGKIVKCINTRKTKIRGTE